MIIQDVERMHAAGLVTMAYYYFDFPDVKKQDRHDLLSSLILQLSVKNGRDGFIENMQNARKLNAKLKQGQKVK